MVAARKINADQKAQILNKPRLQESLAQLEEQITQYKKFDQEYKAKMQSEKSEYEKAFSEKASQELEETVALTKAEGAANALKGQHDGLLLISQFLRLAAIRRGDEEADATLDENKALEGVLAKVYTGDEEAVQTMLQIIKGSNTQTVSVNGEVLTTTCKLLPERGNLTRRLIRFPDADVKATVLAQAPSVAATDAAPSAETSQYPVETDATIANAGLTEIDAPATSTLTNGGGAYEAHAIPQNSGIDDGAANAAAEANWDASNDLSASQEWVEVPRAPLETDTSATTPPATTSNVQSWADDQPDAPEVSTDLSSFCTICCVNHQPSSASLRKYLLTCVISPLPLPPPTPTMASTKFIDPEVETVAMDPPVVAAAVEVTDIGDVADLEVTGVDEAEAIRVVEVVDVAQTNPKVSHI